MPVCGAFFIHSGIQYRNENCKKTIEMYAFFKYTIFWYKYKRFVVTTPTTPLIY